MLTFDIRGIFIKCIEREVIPSGTIGAKIKFVFDDEWQSFNKTVTFDYEDQNRNIKHADLAFSESEILIPPSVVASPGRFRLGIYGANGGSIATPTLYTTWFETPTGAVPSGITPEPPSALVNQIYDIASSAENKAQSAVETSQRAVDIASKTGEQAAAAASSASAAEQSASNSAASASAALSNANAAASSAADAEAARQQAQATADSIIVSNPNLLDNWYFGNPVNQRGQTSYTGEGYGIDRWKSNGATVTVKIEDGEIQVIDNATDWNGIVQLIENYEYFAGKTVTLSALGYAVGAGHTLHLQYGDNSAIANKSFPKDTLDLISFTVKVPDNIDNKFKVRTVRSGTSSGNSTLHLKAIKLELGSQQTLAHLENGAWVLNEIPDYADMLAMCQRYYQLYSSSEKRPPKAIDCRPTMRTDPSQGTIVIGETTYYYNTAEL